MTEFLKEELFTNLEKGKTLVFPTEESARATSVEYALKMQRPLLSRQCISFDTFASLFFEIKPGSTAVSDSIKSFFANWFISKHVDSLKFFYNPNYPEMKDNIASFIVSLLPNLKEAFSSELKLSSSVRADLELILAEYQAFLDKNNLYEQNYLEGSKNVDISDYILISPEAFPKEIKIQRRLPALSFKSVSPISLDTKLDVYIDEKEELRTLFVSIRNLLDRGVGLEEIAISSSALKRLKPYIELEAKLFDIPLAFIQGKSVSETLPGRFLTSLVALYEDGYEIGTMKEFFLNPSMPFANRSDIAFFIEKAVQASIESAENVKEDRYRKLILDGAFSYSNFRRTLDNLMKTKDPARCQSFFQQLLTLLFEDEKFVDTDEDNNVFGFIQDNFKAFLSFVGTAAENGYSIDGALFPIFVSFIKDSNYVDKEKKEGIRVYPFGQGAATPYRYHYLITLNDSESKSEVRDASFLSEFERSGLVDRNVTEELLKVYIAFSENVILSCARETYNGQMLPLVSLMEKQDEKSYEGEDSYILEDSDRLRSDSIYPLQKRGYDMAKTSSLRPVRRNEYHIEPSNDNPELSFSGVNTYEHCHYKYALKKLFDLEKMPMYEISNFDSLEIGTRMHSVLERFERYGQLESPKEIEKYFSEEMDAWRSGKRFKYNRTTGEEELVNMKAGSAIPSEYMISFIRNRFLENMKSLIAKIREESNPMDNGLELYMKAEFPEYGFTLKGIIDKVGISKEDGDLILYDYKTGKSYSKADLEEKRLQFDIYSLLLERCQSRSVKEGKFIYLKANKEATGWKPNEEEELGALKRLIDSAKAMKDGNYDKTNDAMECSGCEFKGICRRRMAIR